MIASGFTWFNLIPSVDHNTAFEWAGLMKYNSTTLHAWLACGMLVTLAIFARIGLSRARQGKGYERYFSNAVVTPRIFFELFVSGLMDLIGESLSKTDKKQFFSLIGSIFLFIFLCNMMGLVPGLLPPTDNINTNVGIAIVVTVVFLWVGLRRDPVGYLKHMWGPVWWLGPFMFSLEMVSQIVRPVSLTLRLTGNMIGDHMVFGIMSDMTKLFIPSLFLALALLVCTIQALIFTLLSAVYIGLSVPHGDQEHAH